MKKILLTLVALVAMSFTVQAEVHHYSSKLRVQRYNKYSWGRGIEQSYKLYRDENEIGLIYIKVNEDKSVTFKVFSHRSIDFKCYISSRYSDGRVSDMLIDKVVSANQDYIYTGFVNSPKPRIEVSIHSFQFKRVR